MGEDGRGRDRAGEGWTDEILGGFTWSSQAFQEQVATCTWHYTPLQVTDN